MLKIKPNNNFTQIFKKATENFVAEVDRRVVQAFEQAAKEAVLWAKQNKTYTDQTGALNASTGFILYRDGLQVAEYFDSFLGNTDGMRAGKEIAAQQTPPKRANIFAVVVAGANYAVYVESKGFDVLTGAEKRFPDILGKKLKENFR
ncbi:MAG: hypothetical protein LBS01_02375 [Prevotellaceae bacterium]|nr:hypothetical protein [Prevotellaceae bacterium]